MFTPVCSASVVVALVACVTDLRTRRIPNALTLGVGCAALLYHLATGGWQGAGTSAVGCLVGFAAFFPLFALGGMGAGDVKLLAALGALVGPITALWTALYAAVAGGVMAIALALGRGYFQTALSNVATLLRTWRLTGVRRVDGMTLETSKSPRLPYALPIAAGLVLALWLH